MKTVKVAEASGAVLDWLVAKCEFEHVRHWPDGRVQFLHPNTDWTDFKVDWAQGGPIIDREGPWVRESAAASPAIADLVTPDKKWFAYAKRSHDGTAPRCYYGETFLVAAMRCYVASKLGDEVEVPEELL